jgi:hypothetical protein
MKSEERTFGLCKNCKHWKRPKSSWEEGYGDCRFLKTEGYRKAENRIAYSYDYENYSSGLSCKEDFGCILFKKRKEKGGLI